MKRIVSVALFGVAAFCLAVAACYNPPTPTPHPGETVGPGATPDLGLVTPGITIPATPRGPTPAPFAQPPGVIESTPVPPSEITSVPPVSDTLTPSVLLSPTSIVLETPVPLETATPAGPTASPLAPTVFQQ